MLQNHEDFYGYVIEIKANSVVLHDMRVHEIYSAEVPSSGEVMNEWRYTSTLLHSFTGVNRYNFTCFADAKEGRGLF